jgi:hypothetical protein
MSNWIKTKTTNGFQTFSRPEYIHFRKEVMKLIASIGGTPGLVASVNGRVGTVILTATDVALGNVDNTSDLNKPISTATQTALDTKLDKLVISDTYIADRTLQLTDNTKMLLMNSGSAIQVIVPLNSSIAHPIGTQVLFTQYGAGQVTITPIGGVTLLSADNKLKTTMQYSTGGLIKIATDTWIVFGDLVV